ncbi:hypothetical protein [Streptomyces sp. CoH17]|uniref:hypothetical protein n=1 Tax=Streptomyces sp. CoH17 TaxID=2992806 RepID=UPI00226F32A9|nr:hypothetical protein [Streptomyces sp. CoH17]
MGGELICDDGVAVDGRRAAEPSGHRREFGRARVDVDPVLDGDAVRSQGERDQVDERRLEEVPDETELNVVVRGPFGAGEDEGGGRGGNSFAMVIVLVDSVSFRSALPEEEAPWGNGITDDG